MNKIDTITLLKYQEGSLDKARRLEVDKYLEEHPGVLDEILDLDRISAVMEEGIAQPVPGTAAVALTIIQGLIDSFQCRGASAELVPVVATRGDSRPQKHETDKHKVSVSLDHLDAQLEILAVRGNAYWVVIKSPLLKGHVVKLKRKGDDYPLYTKKASSESLTVKGLGTGQYEVLFLNDRIDISIEEKV